MPNVLTEPDRLGDLLKFEEVSNLYSRDKVTVANGQNLAFGTVVGRLNSDGTVVAFDSGGGTGNDTAVGIVGEDVDASAGEKDSWIIARHAIVAESAVVWPSGVSANKIEDGTEDLKALGVIIRKDA